MNSGNDKRMELRGDGGVGRDRHVLVRAVFEITRGGRVQFRLYGGHWFRVWLDGAFLLEGPARHAPGHPRYEVVARELGAGRHVLAWHVHDIGVDTRLVPSDAPFGVHAMILDEGGEEIGAEWRVLVPDGWMATGRRLGCVLPWVEWCDRRRVPESWRSVRFDDREWPVAEARGLACRTFEPLEIGPIHHPVHRPEAVDAGELAALSVPDHSPSMSFFIRDLAPVDLPAQGRWWRFDLGRVRLGSPRLRLRSEPGAILQIGYAESLTRGRVCPYLKSGSGPDSCMLDHWWTRGGGECVQPLHPKGARFIEVHLIGGDPSRAVLESFEFVERVYYAGDSDGFLDSGEELLDRIWSVGRDTLASCSEDSLTDNPHRERGQWLGEVVAPCIEIVSACHSDWRPVRRSLAEAARCATSSGLLPAVYPGTNEIIPSFSIQWIRAMLDYVRHTGDRSLLAPFREAARRSLEALLPDLGAEGLLINPSYWNFIDWGYRGASTVFRSGRSDDRRADPALSLFYLEALDSMALWMDWLGDSREAAAWRDRATALRRDLSGVLSGRAASGGWASLGYHACVLALRTGLVEERRPLVNHIREFLSGCFPNNPDGLRLADVTVEAENIITPYFAHFALPELVLDGGIDFVLDQIRVCWGWMLDRGWTTWGEMFDPRWSHCHYWSGTPTWLLSRCLLGLTPAFDRGYGHYDWSLRFGALRGARGRLPLPVLDGSPAQTVSIDWKRDEGGSISYGISTPQRLCIRMPDGEVVVEAGGRRALTVEEAPTFGAAGVEQEHKTKERE